MKLIARKPLAAILLIVGAFGVCICWIALFPDQLAMVYPITLVAFFLAACFLPERRPATFLSRGSALGPSASSVAVLMFRFLNEHHPWENFREISGLVHLMLPISIAIAVAYYWLATFLIRGFRARPEYEFVETPSDRPEDFRGNHPHSSPRAVD